MEVFEKSFYFTHLGFEYFQVKFETKKTIFQRSKVTLLLSGQLSIPRLGLCGHGDSEHKHKQVEIAMASSAM